MQHNFFFHYYLVNRLQYIYKWIHPHQSDNTWLDIEQTFCKNITISDLPFILSHSVKHHQCFQTTISATLTAWWKFHKVKNSTLGPFKFTPIWYNPDFLSSKKPLYLHTWSKKGSPTYSTLFRITHCFHSLTWSSSLASGAIIFLNAYKSNLQFKQHLTLKP